MAEQLSPVAAQKSPLHPPTALEISQAGMLVKQKLGDTLTFGYCALLEPDKQSLLQANTEHERRLSVVGHCSAKQQSFEAQVNCSSERVEQVEWLAQGQAPISFQDVVRVNEICRRDADWKAAVAARGVADIKQVQIDPWPSGGFVHAKVPTGHRVFRAISFVREDKTDNGYARPLQGLIAHVDLTDGRIAYLEDHGVVSLPPESGRYDAASQPSLRTPPKPIDITQPQGVSFTVNGYQVLWQKWQFEISMHPTHGLVLHRVAYQDGAKLRSILHRAALSDMVVPYGDPNPMHAWKHVFDASEAAIGNLANSLTLGCDCLGEIHYFDIDVMNVKGESRQIKNAICMHEEDYGVLWKHYDSQTETQQVRRSRRLVVSAIHTVGNYEYGFFWYFYLDGTLQMEVKLTGIVGVSAVEPGSEQPQFAPLIAPQLASPVHQHLFNFRLDFDLDSGPMSLYEVNTEALPAGHPDNPYGSGFMAQATLLESERAAQRDVDARRSRSWKVVNNASTNRMGQPVAYKLLPGATPVLLASPDSPVGRRAAFAQHNLWATPFAADELSAAGNFTNLHPGGDGLPEYTKANRSLEDCDLVLWHTLGLTHVPRPEDWPVMPVETCGFSLLPVGFFERNPALDLPS